MSQSVHYANLEKKVNSLKIVLTEDDPGIIELMTRILERSQHECIKTVNAKETVEYLKNNNADLLVMDYNLPDSSGEELIERLSSNNIDIPFIVVTAAGNESIAVSMMKKGASDYLVKDNSFLKVLVPTIEKVWKEICLKIELETAKKELFFQNAILTEVQELSLDGIIVINNKDEIVSYNKRFCDIWEYYELQKGDSFKKLFGEIAKKIKNGAEFLNSSANIDSTLEQQSTHRNITLNNGIILELNSSPMMDKSQQSLGRIWYFRDITVQIQARKNIEDAKTIAEETAKSKSDFLDFFSHEVRTPMHSLQGFIEILENSPLDQEQKEYVDTINKSCDNLKSLINNILDLSKLEAGASILDNQLFLLSDLILESQSIISILAEKKGLKLNIDIDKELPVVSGDSMKIRQILNNLLGNAVKFTQEGEVTLSCHIKDNLTHFSIKDNGIGISEEQQKEIFSDFAQAENSTSRKYGGTGLGLSISARLVRLMGSELNVKSRESEGAEFYFALELPIEK